MAIASTSDEAQIISFEGRAAMAARLADVGEALIARALAERGAATLAVSGGSTPAPFYEALSKRDLEWAKVTALLVDERWVRPDHPRSNEAFVKRTLQQNRAAAINVAGMWGEAASPAAGLDEAAARFSRASWPIDLAILGMGEDGHTASWFPHADGLEQALETDVARLAAVTARPSEITGEETDRMTLTLGAVGAARSVFLLTSGDSKRKAFEAAREDGPVNDMPVRAILKARPDIWVCWAP